MAAPRILVIPGSARRESLNVKLARVAAETARAAGAVVTLVDLNEYPMPIYHGDLEAQSGVPESARRLKQLFLQHNALLPVSPENNASVPALLKNTIDWLSRPQGGQSGNVPFEGKIAGLMSASPGAYGGLRGLMHLRPILQTLGVLVLSEQFALARAHEAFGPDGALKDARQQSSVANVVRRLIEVTSRLAG